MSVSLSKPLPEWGHIHAELRRRGVTLALLWEEYRSHHPDGYGYTRRRAVTAETIAVVVSNRSLPVVEPVSA